MNATNAPLTNAVPGFVEDQTVMGLPPWWQHPLVLAAALVLLALLVAGALRYGRSLRRSFGTRRARRLERLPGEPAEAWILRRLAELAERAPALGGYRLAIECSWVLRLYLEARFELPVIFQTTREFLEHARTSEALGPEQRAGLGRYLDGCDRVKFGRRGLTEAETAALIDDARGFVALVAGRAADPAEVVHEVRQRPAPGLDPMAAGDPTR